MNKGPAITTRAAAASTPAIANPRRLKPAAVVKIVSSDAAGGSGRMPAPVVNGQLMSAVCDPFVAGGRSCSGMADGHPAAAYSRML
jgi:hypothetical protein